ncbi:protein NnrT [Marivita sp. S0852]|uniref:protein NnrT n=1 Tax=Marivita sp. S0852 TaxID=3373893 RepID=UPI003981E076
MRFLFPLTSVLCAFASSGFAAEFDRPIPQAQSATAEFWYALACVMLIASMGLVQWLVTRR